MMMNHGDSWCFGTRLAPTFLGNNVSGLFFRALMRPPIRITMEHTALSLGVFRVGNEPANLLTEHD